MNPYFMTNAATEEADHGAVSQCQLFSAAFAKLALFLKPGGGSAPVRLGPSSPANWTAHRPNADNVQADLADHKPTSS